MARKKRQPQPPVRKVSSREKQLVSLAVDLAEQQLRDGTAPATVITHFLKLGTTSYELERQKLKYETELIQAKTENLRSIARADELIENAFKALRGYQGVEESDDDQDQVL